MLYGSYYGSMYQTAPVMFKCQENLDTAKTNIRYVRQNQALIDAFPWRRLRNRRLRAENRRLIRETDNLLFENDRLLGVV